MHVTRAKKVRHVLLATNIFCLACVKSCIEPYLADSDEGAVTDLDSNGPDIFADCKS